MAAIKQVLIGDTIKVTWVSSATVPSQATMIIRNGSDTAVSSVAMISSGSGHFYANYTIPDSGSQYYVAETIVFVSSLQYKKRTKFKAILGEVD